MMANLAGARLATVAARPPMWLLRPGRLSQLAPPCATRYSGMSERARGSGRRVYGPAPPPPSAEEEEEEYDNTVGEERKKERNEPSAAALRDEALLGENGETPAWVRNIIEAAEVGDPEYVKLLEGTNNDPVKIMKNVTKSLAEMREARNKPSESPLTSAEMRVRFREIDHFNLWIWVKLQDTPTAKEREMVSEVFLAWFTLGRLTAFNCSNQQLFHNATGDVSFYDYDHEQLESGLSASFHEMSEPEFKDNWCRVWIDTGTADEFAFDLLINAFNGFNREHSAVTDLVFGGQNSDWPTPRIKWDPLSDDVPQGAEFLQQGDSAQVPGYELDELEMGNMDDLDKYLQRDMQKEEDMDDEDLGLFGGPMSR
mmetsp:Transcript_1680/g.4354  ORF Transcript_1680/g.4354 Transcript_1680/m.4354 type:complete len:370 (+) Transcript_1680:216-1325(+)